MREIPSDFHAARPRDPKVIWHEIPKEMDVVPCRGAGMEIYSSADLKAGRWRANSVKDKVSRRSQECPDLLELPVEGTELKKWVLVCNLNPGGPFGGSCHTIFH